MCRFIEAFLLPWSISRSHLGRWFSHCYLSSIKLLSLENQGETRRKRMLNTFELIVWNGAVHQECIPQLEPRGQGLWNTGWPWERGTPRLMSVTTSLSSSQTLISSSFFLSPWSRMHQMKDGEMTMEGSSHRKDTYEHTSLHSQSNQGNTASGVGTWSSLPAGKPSYSWSWGIDIQGRAWAAGLNRVTLPEGHLNLQLAAFMFCLHHARFNYMTQRKT